MKKWILMSGLMALGLISHLQASVSPPLDYQGHELTTINFVGSIPCGIDSSTGTNAVLCGSGSGFVYGVIVSSVPNTDYIVFRDSAIANTSSSIVETVYANGTGANATGASTTQTYKFPVPMKFTNGICVNAINAPGSTRSSWVILYRPQTAGE